MSKYAPSDILQSACITSSADAEEDTDEVKKQRLLEVLRCLHMNECPELWRAVSDYFLLGGLFDLSGVVSAANVPDLEYFLSSGEASAVTKLRYISLPFPVGRQNPDVIGGTAGVVSNF